MSVDLKGVPRSRWRRILRYVLFISFVIFLAAFTRDALIDGFLDAIPIG